MCRRVQAGSGAGRVCKQADGASALRAAADLALGPAVELAWARASGDCGARATRAGQRLTERGARCRGGNGGG